MPNYVKNIVRIKADEKILDKLEKAVAEGENEFSFNKIIPMPKTLMVESSSLTERCVKAAQGDKKAKEWLSQFSWEKKGLSEDTEYLFQYKSPTSLEDALYLGEVIKDNLQKYQAATWYDWCNENWGTKWNAGNVSKERALESLTYTFETAWAAPLPVFVELVERFPNIEIVGAWADEDMGYNCGKWEYSISTGLTGIEYDGGEPDAIALAEKVWKF